MSLPSILSGFPLLWAQAGAPTVPSWLLWLFVWGNPSVTILGPLGGLVTWIKVVGLFSLIGWAGSWIVTALKDRQPLRGRARQPWVDFAIPAAIGLGLMSAFAVMLQSYHQLPASVSSWLPTALGVAAGLLFVVWVEIRLFGVLMPRGTAGDRVVLIGLHLALGFGFFVSLLMFRMGALMPGTPWQQALFLGGRLGATYMGFVVLARLFQLVLPEIKAVRFRRLYAIGWQSWIESFRRMGAPWVVLVLFVITLAFGNWFMQTPRPAELGRLYVYALMLLVWLLLSLLIVFLAPISLPFDIRQQTIYTVVTKPVRRLELVWGRMLGYMALVTLLIAIFSLVSLAYYDNQIGAAIRDTEAKAKTAERENKTEFARQFREQADQLKTRMAARSPVYGSLMFFDSRGIQRRRGIDVGMELPLRSFIEGATPSRAIWQFGPAIPNPWNPQDILDRRVPVENLLKPKSIEWLEDQLYTLGDRIAKAEQDSTAQNIKPADVRRMAEAAAQARKDAKQLQDQLENLRQQEATYRKEGKTSLANKLHSPAIPIEMTFTVYRTTKGEIGEPVYAQMVVTNPRPGIAPHRDVLPVKEYYTNKRFIPSKVLVGSGGSLLIDVKCTSVNQYLGMADGDLFLLQSQGRFEGNFLRGLFGIWLQAMVLTAIGVCVGTFLSWPVALLCTLFFFLAGNVGFTALQQFALDTEKIGGGPFESLIRVLSHNNLVTDLAPTTAVVVAKTFDSIMMPILARLVYLVPNFNALDVSNLVADGFAVTWSLLAEQLLLAVGYALPFSIAGYFILRNREVAA